MSERILMSGERWRIIDRQGVTVVETKHRDKDGRNEYDADKCEWTTLHGPIETVFRDIAMELVATRLELERFRASTPTKEAEGPKE